MPGTALRVLEKSTFSGKNIPLNTTSTIPVAVQVPVGPYLYAGIILRVHSWQIITAGTGTAPQVSVSLANSAPTPEDPASLFRSASFLDGSAVAYSTTFVPTLAFDSTSAAGRFGNSVDVLLNIKQYVLTAGDFNVAISIDLSLKS
jgi:hypothetical protein